MSRAQSRVKRTRAKARAASGARVRRAQKRKADISDQTLANAERVLADVRPQPKLIQEVHSLPDYNETLVDTLKRLIQEGWRIVAAIQDPTRETKLLVIVEKAD